MIFALTGLHNFIKDHLSKNTNYFEAKNEDAIIQFGGSNNLSLGNSLVIFIWMNRKKDAIVDII